MLNKIKVNKLRITLDGTALVDDASFTIPLKSTTLILADNSLTSQYLLKTIGGIRIPDSGNVLLENYDVFDTNPIVENIIKKRISYVFENGALISNLNILQNLLLTLDFHFPTEPFEKKISRINAYLNDFELDIDLNFRPSELKIEQLKLLGFIRALLSEPDIIIFDEPFMFTDTNTKKIIIRKMKELKANQYTLIIKTQFNEEFVKQCNLVYYFKLGRLVFDGPIENYIKFQTEF